MRQKTVLQLAVLLALGLGVLLSLMTFDRVGLPAPQPLEISAIIRETDSSDRSATRQGMEQAAADLGAQLRFFSLNRETSVGEQRQLLVRELDRGADAVVLAPVDSLALADAVEDGAEQAVLVTLESDLSYWGAAACIGPDNEALGQALGEAVLRGVPRGGSVLVISSAPNSGGLAARKTAAVAVLEEGEREVLLCAPGGGGDLPAAIALALAEGRPDGVLALDPAALECAVPFTAALERPPLVYGAGSTSTIAAYLEGSDITLIAAYNEYAAGYLAVETAANVARGIPAVQPEPLAFSLLRQEDMYDADNQKLLFPVTR